MKTNAIKPNVKLVQNLIFMSLLWTISVAVHAEDLDNSLLIGPDGSHFNTLDTYYQIKCGTLVASPAYGNTTEVGCAASDGTNRFESFDGGNNGFDAGRIWGQICKKGLNPSKFKWACYANGDMTDIFTKAGAKLPEGANAIIGENYQFPLCERLPKTINCPSETDSSQFGCVARLNSGPKETTVSVFTKGNNCHAYVQLLNKLCKTGKIDNAIGSACYVKK